MGLVVSMDSALPALTRKTKKFRLVTKKLLVCRRTATGKHISEQRHDVSVIFYYFIRWLSKQTIHEANFKQVRAEFCQWNSGYYSKVTLARLVV